MNPFSVFTHLLKTSPTLRPEVPDALQRVAGMLGEAGTPGRMAAIDPGFAAVLAAPVSRALDYCDALLVQVPGVIDLERGAFATDSLVHALFAGPGDIEAMLGRSQHLREYLAGHAGEGGEYLYALLAARRHEKSTLGVELDGDVLRAGVPQHLLYFSDHTLVEPVGNPEALHARLRLVAFDSLIGSFCMHLAETVGERQRLRDSRAFESAHLAVSRGHFSAPAEGVHARRIAELDERLAALGDTLQPMAVLEALADSLLRPESSLRLEPVQVCVDRSGVIRSGHEVANGDADLLVLPELIARDRRRHVVFLARFRHEEAVRAVAEARDRQARFILI